MGREIKRVPLDFDHPIDEIWPGFLNPHPSDWPACEACSYDEPPTLMGMLFPPSRRQGTGLTPEAYAISQTFYPHMIGGPMADKLAWHDKLGQAEVDYLVEKGRLSTFSRREPTEDNPRDWEWLQLPRIAAEVNAENRPGRKGFSGHDGINRMYLVEFRCRVLGIETECKTCKGHGDIATDEQRKASDDWTETEPPTGDGWQLWETVSEGSPVSPVFATADELATWMSDPERGDQWVPGDVAAKFIADGWAPSMVSSAETGVIGGVEFMGTREVTA